MPLERTCTWRADMEAAACSLGWCPRDAGCLPWQISRSRSSCHCKSVELFFDGGLPETAVLQIFTVKFFGVHAIQIFIIDYVYSPPLSLICPLRTLISSICIKWAVRPCLCKDPSNTPHTHTSSGRKIAALFQGKTRSFQIFLWYFFKPFFVSVLTKVKNFIWLYDFSAERQNVSTWTFLFSDRCSLCYKWSLTLLGERNLDFVLFETCFWTTFYSSSALLQKSQLFAFLFKNM